MTGIILLAVGLVISLIASRFYPKGYRIKSCLFLWVNGLIIFSYMMIIGIPLGKVVSNIIEAADPYFLKWKYGNIDSYDNDEEDSDYVSIPKIRMWDLADESQIIIHKPEEYAAMSFEELVSECRFATEEINKIMAYIEPDTMSAMDFASLFIENGFAGYLLCNAFGSDKKLNNTEYKFISEIYPTRIASAKDFNEFMREFYNEEKCEIEIQHYISKTVRHPFEKLVAIIIMCGMVVDGPLNEKEKAFLDYLGISWMF